MSAEEKVPDTPIRDAQWYKDYLRISEGIRLKLYRYV